VVLLKICTDRSIDGLSIARALWLRFILWRDRKTFTPTRL
jgi:hypothetical protein